MTTTYKIETMHLGCFRQLRVICFAFIAILFTGNWLFALDPLIILVGPPGSGKGAFSQYLEGNYGYNHISIGDILRREIDMQTELGCEIEEIVRRGDYIDPQIINVLLAKNVVKYQAEEKPFILDGFGQNKGDVERMQKLLEETGLIPRTFVMYLETSDAVCQERIANRLVCSGCGHVYNKVTAKPTVAGICDGCGMALKARTGDTPEVILKRLIHYRDCVEKYNKAAAFLFPSIIYESDGSFEECALFYDNLAKEAMSWNEDSSSFVREFVKKRH